MFIGETHGTRRLCLVLPEHELDYNLEFASRNDLDMY